MMEVRHGAVIVKLACNRATNMEPTSLGCGLEWFRGSGTTIMAVQNDAIAGASTRNNDESY